MRCVCIRMLKEMVISINWLSVVMGVIVIRFVLLCCVLRIGRIERMMVVVNDRMSV